MMRGGPVQRGLALVVLGMFVMQGLLVAVSAGPDGEIGGTSRQGDPDMKEWTFIVFLFSDSSQHGGTLNSYYNMVKNMETKGGWSDENVNVLVLIDRHPVHAPDKDGDTHAYYVQEGEGNSKEIALNEIHLEWYNEVNMGSRYTLKHFGTYAIENYPAEHYVVVTRSAGWWPDNFGEDETSGDNLNPFEMRSVMAELSQVAGKKIDILNIAGCTSGMFEWAYDYHPFVDYYVATETYSIGSNWRIYYWINDLRKDLDMSPADFTEIIVKEYVNKDRSGYNPYNSLTVSSADLSKIKGVAEAIDRLSLAMKDDLRSHIHQVWMARDRTAEIDNYLRVDVYEWAYQVSLQFPEGSTVHDAAVDVMDLFDEMIIFNERHTGIENSGVNVTTARGLCLFFVRDSEVHWANAVEGYRARLHFNLEVHWLDFLDDYFSYFHEKVAYASGDAFIEVHAFCGDLDGDSYADDMFVQVWTNDGYMKRDVEIYANGDFWGKTNVEGWFANFNLPKGDYIITAIYNEFSAMAGVHIEGAGPGYQLILEAYGLDLDGDGWKDDVQIWLHDSRWEPIPWAILYSGNGLMGWTREDGMFWGLNYQEGTHLVHAIIGEEYFAIGQFYSEGEGSQRLYVDPSVMDYSNDGNVNDLDLHVLDHEDTPVDGAIVYMDDEYLGETYDGRIMKKDLEEGWHWADVYWKEEKEVKAAYFKDVHVRLVDLNNDSLVETASVFYDVEVVEAAMDVKVTEQVFLWNDGSLKGIYYDNFTVVKGQEVHRFINYTTDHTRFVNLTLTLMDEDGFVEDRWILTGVWLEAAVNEPPEARLFVRPTYTYPGETVTFNGTTSEDIDGNVTLYSFDFGDGTTTGWINASVVNHTYSEPGNYTAVLMVMDDLGVIDDRSNRITIWVRPLEGDQPPKARLFVRPTYTYPWEVVSLNGSTSEDEEGIIVMYMFNFGDGTVSGWTNSSMVEHTYNKPGNYTVVLKVRDDTGAESDWSNRITVWVRDDEGNSPPHAYFTARPSKVNVNETVAFNASGSSDKDGYVYRYLFDFGDGTNSSWIYESVTTHVYTSPGYYTATVLVEDDLETVSELSTPRGIDVTDNVLPRPYMFARPHYIDVDEDVTFNASGSWDDDGNVVLYMFDFGDGTTSGWTSEPVQVHRYTKAGNYTVVLYVQDDRGGMSTSTSRSTVTVRKTTEDALMDAPALTAVVVALFVVLMIAGSWYEMKKVRLKSYEAPAGAEGAAAAPPDEEEEEDDDGPPPDEEDEARKGLGSITEEGELEEQSDETEQKDVSEEGAEVEEEKDGKIKRKGLDSRSQAGELDAHDHDEEDMGSEAEAEEPPRPELIRVRCSGCGARIKVKKGPRPLRIRCKSCGKKGVLR